MNPFDDPKYDAQREEFFQRMDIKSHNLADKMGVSVGDLLDEAEAEGFYRAIGIMVMHYISEVPVLIARLYKDGDIASVQHGLRTLSLAISWVFLVQIPEQERAEGGEQMLNDVMAATQSLALDLVRTAIAAV